MSAWESDPKQTTTRGNHPMEATPDRDGDQGKDNFDPIMDAYRAKVFGRLFAKPPPSRRIGRYTVLDVLGKGGMGIVLRGRDDELDRPVAIKLMLPDRADAEDAHRRFEREAKALARLRNNNIVQIYDYGFEHDTPYIVMELLEGETLQARLARENTLSPAIILRYLKQIGAALTSAAKAGIIHRDLKPANIFISKTDDLEHLKLLDFGLMSWSHLTEIDSSTKQGLTGTPAYMSPEQVRGKAPRHVTDLWALGVIAYEALTGSTPFSGRTFGDLIVSICTDSFVSPSTLLESLPSGFDDFFNRALAKETSNRFQSASELIDAFSRLTLESKPIKLLVVDDEPDMQLLLTRYLSRGGKSPPYELVIAHDGKAALEQLQKNPDIDIVLADINMPRMDGLTLLERLSSVAPHTKAIIASAYDDMSNIRRAMNLGAFDFLVKPFNMKDLEATIEKTIAHIKKHRDLTRSERENRLMRRFMSSALLEKMNAPDPSGAFADDISHGTVSCIVLSTTAPNLDEPPKNGFLGNLNRQLEIITSEIRKRGGSLSELHAHGVVAVYNENYHFTRAAEACVAIMRRLQAFTQRDGTRPTPSMSLATGTVLSGCIGSRAHGRLAHVAMGSVVTRATTLARTAAPGEILAHCNHRLASTLAFDIEPIIFPETTGSDSPRTQKIIWDRDSLPNPQSSARQNETLT